MMTLSELLSLLKQVQDASHEQQEVFHAADDLVRKDGFTLYWDDTTERYCLCPLEGTVEAGSPMQEEDEV